MNIFRIMKSSLKAKIKEKFPFEVIYRVTGRCNLRCEYCVYPMLIKEMTTEEAKRAIKEFADEGTLIWNFTGGEPLLRKDIGELINYAKDSGIPYVRLYTNGILFKSRINEVRNADTFSFSLDGPKEVHDKLRGKGSFDKAIEAINIAKKEGMNFTINCVVTRINTANDFQGVKYVLNLAKKLDSRVIFLPGLKRNLIPFETDGNSPKVYWTQHENDSFFLSKEELAYTFTFLKKIPKYYKKAKYSPQVYDLLLKAINNQKIDFPCFAGRRFCYISQDGRVIPAIGFRNEGIHGTSGGFVNAFYRLKHKHTSNCFLYCLPDLNQRHRLNFQTVFQYFSVLANEIKWFN